MPTVNSCTHHIQCTNLNNTELFSSYQCRYLQISMSNSSRQQRAASFLWSCGAVNCAYQRGTSKENGIKPYLCPIVANLIVCFGMACGITVRCIVGDLNGKFMTIIFKDNAHHDIKMIDTILMICFLFYFYTQQPFEACCSCTRDINKTLEDFTTWPKDCGNAIMKCSSSCPAPT